MQVGQRSVLLSKIPVTGVIACGKDYTRDGLVTLSIWPLVFHATACFLFDSNHLRKMVAVDTDVDSV